MEFKMLPYIISLIVLSIIARLSGHTLYNPIAERIEAGYPKGYLPYCKGTTKPAEIPRSQLKNLAFVIQGKGQNRKRYSYWDARNMVRDPKLDLKKKTMVVSLGYMDSVNWPIAAIVANEYEARGYNVIIVDYQWFTTVHYFVAVRLMRPVGKHVAEFLVNLGLKPSKIELFGFSLGGQTVSFIAKNYQRLTGRNVSQITSLEPSGPCFRELGPDQRLVAADADFVLVVHTNIDAYGIAARSGHVDFYVNGGEYQPSDLWGIPCLIGCSHFQVVALWLAALKYPKKFIAMKCDSIQQARDSECYETGRDDVNYLGLDVNKTKHGIFYLATGIYHPYYLGEDGTKEEFMVWNRISNVNDGNETEVYT